MRPYVVTEIRDAKGQILSRIQPHIRRRAISAHTARTLIQVLEGVVTRGTGTRAAVAGFRVAGKTGTAQKIDARTGSYSRTKVMGSFAGFVPADRPRLAMVVIIDEPEEDTWGGAVAAPVFSRVAQQVLPYLGLYPEDHVKVADMAATRTERGEL